MKKKMNFTKTNSSHRYGYYHVGREGLWGNYCPDTGEYYLACTRPDGIEVLASGSEMPDGEWQEETACGYSYEVVRELLQLGHLTPQTLEVFLQEGGEVWWDQPNFSI